MRRSAIMVIGSVLLAQAGAALAGSYTCTERSHNWIGGMGPSGSEWFLESNWDPACFGGSPTDHPFPVYFGPGAQYVNGVFVGHQLPVAPAILSSDYDFSPRLAMRAWDGPSVLTITNGATYTTNAEIGGLTNPVHVYEPSGPIEPATLNLDGGFTAGSWTFLEHSQLNLSGGVVYDSSVWSGALGGLSIAQGTGVVIRGRDFPLLPSAVDNAGFIQLADEAATVRAILAISGPVSLHGGGEIRLASSLSLISTLLGAEGDRLINIDNVIRGHGTMDVATDNRHVIRAEGGTLVLPPYYRAFENTGEVQVAADGVLRVVNGDHSFGKLAIFEGGRLDHDSFLRDVDLIGPAALVIEDQWVHFSGSVVNRTGFVLGPGESDAWDGIAIYGQTTLGGGGEVVLLSDSAIISTSWNGGVPELMNVDNTIRGFGQIDVPITNRGVIRAEGGELRFWSEDTLRDNADGEIQVESNGVLYLRNINYPVGRLRVAEGGRIADGSALKDVDLIGPAALVIEDQWVHFSGSVVNRTGFVLGPGESDAWDGIAIYGQTTLGGGGEVVLLSDSAIISTIWNGGVPELMNVDNTIRGFGQIDVPITNRGVIRAEGGELRFWSEDTLRDNTDGEIQVESNGVLYLRNINYPVGRLRVAEGGRIANSSALKDVNLISAAPLVVEDAFLTVFGEVINPVGIHLNAGQTQAWDGLLIGGTVALRGGGELVMSSPEAILEPDGTYWTDHVLVNHDNTVRGRGWVRVPVVNHHMVKADGGLLYLDYSLTGDGDVEIAEGATLRIFGDLSCHTLRIAGGGSLDFRGGNLSVQNWIGDLNPGDFVSGIYGTGPNPGPATVVGNVRFGDFYTWTIGMRLGGSEVGQFDQLGISGDLHLGAAALDLSLVDGFCPAPGDTFQILTVGGTLTGTFADFPEGASVGPLCGTEFFITYQGGDGNDVVLWSQERPFCELCLPSWGGWRGTLGR